MFAKGQGVAQDYVQAHKWLNLAGANAKEAKNCDTAMKNRKIVAEIMQPAQIAEAQRLASAWREELRRAAWAARLLREQLTVAASLLSLAMFAAASSAAAHPGGLNATGCHNDRKNGGYHCHRVPVREVLPFRQSSTDSAYYPNCAAARAAGAAPIRFGDPGYRAGLDRDRDGIACE